MKRLSAHTWERRLPCRISGGASETEPDEVALVETTLALGQVLRARRLGWVTGAALETGRL